MQPGATPDISTLVKSVITDMSAAEKGGQWLLSSYAPFKEKIPFHGFEDHSMEEIRYQFYESVKNGTSDQFKRNLQYLLQQAALKIKALQSPSADVINMVKTIYNTLSPNAANSQSQQAVGVSTIPVLPYLVAQHKIQIFLQPLLRLKAFFLPRYKLLHQMPPTFLLLRHQIHLAFLLLLNKRRHHQIPRTFSLTPNKCRHQIHPTFLLPLSKCRHQIHLTYLAIFLLRHLHQIIRCSLAIKTLLLVSQ